MKRYNRYWKLKFYLSKGKHCRHWQIRGKNKEELYFNPNLCSIRLYNCLLTNNLSISTKTFNGANRQPCAWVKCDRWSELEAVSTPEQEYQPIYFNPKICPFWQDKAGNNIDQQEFEEVLTIGSKVFVAKNQMLELALPIPEIS